MSQGLWTWCSRKILRYTSMHAHLENKSFYSVNNLCHLLKNEISITIHQLCGFNTEVISTQRDVHSF